MKKRLLWLIISLLVISILYSTVTIEKNLFGGEVHILRNHQYTPEIKEYIRDMKKLFIPFIIFDFMMIGVIIVDIIKNVFATKMVRSLLQNVFIAISKIIVIFAVSLSFSKTIMAQSELITTGHILTSGIEIIGPVILSVILFFISGLFTYIIDRRNARV